MAVEVAAGYYLFEKRSGGDDAEFRHSPLHDLESIWWMAVWTCFGFVPSSDEICEDEDRLDQLRLAFDKLFPQSTSSSAHRLSALVIERWFNASKIVLPKSMKGLGSLAVAMRNVLADWYHEAEQIFPIPKDCPPFEVAHAKFIQMIDDVRRKIPLDVIVVPVGRSKRKAEDELEKPSKRSKQE